MNGSLLVRVRFAFFVTCVAFASIAVGCGPIGGFNFNYQEPGGDPSRPTDITGGSADSTDGKSRASGVGHSRLALSKDGRFVLFARTDDTGLSHYQPYRQNDYFGSFDDWFACMYRHQDPQTGEPRGEIIELKKTIWRFDLKQNKLARLELQLDVNRVKVVMHPKGKSFFLLTYTCVGARSDSQPHEQLRVSLKNVVEYDFETLKAQRHFRADGGVLSRSSASQWASYSPSGAVDAQIPFPAEMDSFVMSPQGNYLGFYGHTDSLKTSTGHQLFLIDLKQNKHRKAVLSSPLLQLAFAQDESAIYAVGSKEFDTYAITADARCKSDDPKAPKPAFCKQYEGWIDLVKIHLKRAPSPLVQARLLGFQVDGHLRIPNAAHGQGGYTRTLTLSPDGQRLVLSACNELDWEAYSCSGKLFVVQTQDLKIEQALSALGPAGFTPDNSAIVGWDGKRNHRGQVLIPFPFPRTGSKDTDIRHNLALFDTKTWKRKSVELPMHGPMFFITPGGNFVVTISDLGQDSLVITDLDAGKSTTLSGKYELGEFAVSTDGTTIYTVEQGGIKKLDLKQATVSDVLPQGRGVENLHVLPKGASFPLTPGKDEQVVQMPKLQTKLSLAPSISKLKASLQGSSLKTVTLPWKRIDQGKQKHKDNLLISRFGRRYFEVWSNTSVRLFQRKMSYDAP